MMEYYININCDKHKNLFECPDCILYHQHNSDEYGIIVHDGGESYIAIQYCPWCGKKLSNQCDI